jgi:serine/threonine-protein kinase
MPPAPSPGRFRQADAILDAALDLEGDERLAFVERACEGNPALKSMVQRLLRALEHSSDFLSASAVEVARPLLDVVTAPGGEQEALPPPEQVGPYHVLRELGRGGMGVVYLATRDDDLSGDLVALKTLRGGALVTGTLLRRFLSERRILATLDHPFIARLHDSGITPGGEPYFAMAYCAGESLAKRLSVGCTSVAEALRVTRQLAEALSAAHAVGIVHRDIKPANVLFTAAGEVQLTDFGIAKLLDQDTTHSGMLVGTPAYLAPEQLRGLSVDHRADLWSLGVTLYEMLAHRRPFEGPSYAAVLHAVLTVDPEPIAPKVAAPPAVDALLRHLLRREPDGRPASAAEVARAIAAIEADPAAPYAPATPGRTDRTPTPQRGGRELSLVVLPFSNTSGDASDDPLTDGLTDELIGALGKVRSLRVTARTTAFALRRRGLDARAIANVLGVSHVLEGTVRRSGNRIKVAVQLVQATEGTIAWTETYDRVVEDIFELQERLAAAIVAELALTLAPTEPNTTTPPQLDIAAYDLYLKGRFFAEKRTARGLERAVEYFGRAVERDPEYAEAHAGLADAYVMLAAVCNQHPGQCLPLARAAIAEALRLGDGLAAVHATHGNLLSAFEWEWEEAERELRKAMDLAPGHIPARLYLALHQQHLGRCDEAIQLASAALMQDPLSPGLNLALGRAHLHARRPAEALRPLRTAIEIAPGLGFGHRELGHALLALGRSADALSAFRRGAESGGPNEVGQLAYALSVLGERESAEGVLRNLLASEGTEYLPPFGVACAYAGLGDREAAFAWLDRGFEQRAAQMNCVKVAPAFAGIREDARFGALLARMNIPSGSS